MSYKMPKKVESVEDIEALCYRKRKPFGVRVPLVNPIFGKLKCVACGYKLNEPYKTNADHDANRDFTTDYNPTGATLNPKTGVFEDPKKWCKKLWTTVKINPKSKEIIPIHYYCKWVGLMNNIERVRTHMRDGGLI
tara:strand:+ start:929 stop:1336 length:408 start_codon:yes stop_codon:yes gene_type:complete